jgi:hypothetical protein
MIRNRDWTDLHYAVWNHDFDQVRSLARMGTINSLDSSGWSPLHLACTSEESHLFDIHQINARGLTRFDSGKKYNRFAWGPTRKHSSISDNSERTQSMGILEILLENGASPNAKAKNFCTPLHCAANSGWASHAIALIDTGAEVYTGPKCSPLCWVKGGSGSSHPVARLLRDKLGPEGMKLIDEDHQREASSGNQAGNFPRAKPRAAVQDFLPLNREIPTPNRLNQLGRTRLGAATSGLPLFQRKNEKRPAARPVNSDGLCLTCANISLDDLVSKPGYIHLSSLELVRESAILCSFCKVIFALLGQGRKIDRGDVTQVIVRAIADELKYYQPGDILRMLELKLSAGCFCAKSYGAVDRSLDFKNCQGKCEVLATARVGIFTLEGICSLVHYVRG